jgi:hypothetical protein
VLVARDKFVKSLSAILFSLLLVWVQLLAAPAPACASQPVRACCHCGGKMSCCATSASGSQPAPALPANAGPQNQLLPPQPASRVWALPENGAGLPSSGFASPLTATAVPLFARHCIRLI